MKRILSLGLVTPSFKRFFSLFVLLLMSVSAMAEDIEVTVAQNYNTDGSVKPGSLAAAFSAINKAPNKDYVLKFSKGLGTIEISKTLTVSNVKSLYLHGQKGVKVVCDEGKYLEFDNIGDLQVDSISFKTKKDYDGNFNFYKLLNIIDSNVSLIDSCQFEGAALYFEHKGYFTVTTKASEVKKINNCRFSNSAHGICGACKIDYIEKDTNGTGEGGSLYLSNCSFQGSVPNDFICVSQYKSKVIATNNIFSFSNDIKYSINKYLKNENIHVTYEKGNYIIKGTASSNSIIELYANNGYKQNAVIFLGKSESDVNGNFEFTIPKEKLKDNPPIFVYTVTDEDGTSAFSEPHSLDFPKEIYVTKTGTGSGTWDDPMGEKDFAVALRMAKDGTTFHVAQGNYDLHDLTEGLYVSKVNNDFQENIQINNKVTIIGGYRTFTSEKEKSDPANYETILSSSCDGVSHSELILNSGAEFHNLSFENLGVDLGSKNVIIDSCRFYAGSKYARSMPQFLHGVNVVGSIKNTSFSGICYHAISLEDPNINIENCTFENVKSEYALIWLRSAKKLEILNTTFCSNEGNKLIYSESCPIYLYNNTFINNEGSINTLGSSNMYLHCYGNIFINQKFSNSGFSIKGNYNLFNDTKDKLGENYYLIGNEDIPKLLSGSLKEGAFIPNLSNNGGYTKTVKLLNDVLTDGSIRFPLKETVVTTDQRGVTREDPTCPGAYELLASESIDRNATDYYVATKGTGNGSDWENAMSFKTFAEFVPEAAKGVTFHFAAGEYTYDKDITIANDVTLMGGYSASPSATDVPSSCGTKTIFSIKSKLEFGNGLKKVDIKNISFGESAGINIPTSDNFNLLLNINNCTLYALSVGNAKEINIKNSTLLTNVSNVIDVYAHAIFVESCFINSEGLIIHDHFKFRSFSNTTIRNSTIKGSSADVVLFSYGNVYFYNNTVCHAPYQIKDVYTKISLEGERAVIVGNILNTKGFSYIASKGETVSNNVVFGTNNSFDAENNIIVNASDFDGFVEGKVSGSGFSFSPADNGGCTKTVKLLSSYITDDKTYVRYPKSVYYISEDQRGEKRMDFLCPGSYEIPYEVVDYSETICRGSKYEENGFEIDSRDSLGGEYTYYRYEEADVNKLHTLKLTITPQSCGLDMTRSEYYVKKDGDGNGSSWKNAMSDADFVSMLPHAKEGTTFYIAAGEYDFYELSNGAYLDKSRNGSGYYGRYKWENKVNLIGGYPAEAQDITEPSDPKKNPTVFTNSFFCDPLNITSYLDVRFGTVRNIVFKDFQLSEPSLVDSCEFYSDFSCLKSKSANHYAISFGSKQEMAHVKNSIFSGDYYWGISGSGLSELIIEGCIFESINTRELVYGPSTGTVKIHNNTFIDNNVDIQLFKNHNDEEIVNNTSLIPQHFDLN